LISVIKSSLFETDFEREALYLCDVDPAVAQRFIDAVEGVIQMVAAHPAIGPVWRYGHPAQPTRYVLVPGFHNHLIFYRFEGRQVRLGRLLHGAQDLKEILGEELA
jgi:plasmid stabilization system protein ParE